MGKPKPHHSFRLLLVEVLHWGKFFKNQEYRKKATPNLTGYGKSFMHYKCCGVDLSLNLSLNLNLSLSLNLFIVYYPLNFGSEISLRPSAIRLKEKTEMKMAKPGNKESHGAFVS